MKKYLLLLLPFLLIGCEEEELNNYMQARQCLNKASKEQAQGCIGILAGDNSARANKLKCAAGFLEQGLSNARLAQIFSNMQQNSNSGFETFATNLIFESSVSASDAKTKATTTNAYCVASGSTGMALFGSMAATATIMAESVAGWTGAFDDFSGRDLGSASGNEVDLGNNILAIQNSFCVTDPTNEVCSQIQQVTGGSTDPATIGANLIAYF